MFQVLLSRRTLYTVIILYIISTCAFFRWFRAQAVNKDSFAWNYQKEVEEQLDELLQNTRNLVNEISQHALLPLLSGTLNDLKNSWTEQERLIFGHTNKGLTKGSLAGLGDPEVFNESNQLNHYHLAKLRSYHEEWRLKAAIMSFKQIQRQIYNHQHPADCSSTKKLYCDINKKCGLGCQTHHALTCLIAALALNRTLILISKPWQYSDKGWETYFYPVTNCIATKNVTSELPLFTNDIDSGKYPDVFYPFYPSPTPDWLPFSIPAGIIETVEKFHARPSIWWIGQGLKYLWRIKPEVSKIFDDDARKHRMEKPYVGVHVRRTDKLLAEAKFQSLGKYMGFVEQYYNRIPLAKKKRLPKRVYLASDTANIYTEFRSKYGLNYTLYGSTVVSKPDGSRIQRFSEESLLGIIKDIYFLSQSEHLVCTFSSNVCRLAYALMQTTKDATLAVDSLDDDFWLQGSGARQFHATFANKKRNLGDLEVEAGDKLVGISNQWNGFVIGRNVRTSKQGNIPSYKIEEDLILSDIDVHV